MTAGEKELAVLIPIAGALLNGALNVAFQQLGHTRAKDDFRMQVLGATYGEDRAQAGLRDALRRLQRVPAAGLEAGGP